MPLPHGVRGVPFRREVCPHLEQDGFNKMWYYYERIALDSRRICETAIHG